MRSRLAYNDNDLIMSVSMYNSYKVHEFRICDRNNGKEGRPRFVSEIFEICHLS